MRGTHQQIFTQIKNNMNQAILFGHISRTPEGRIMPNGKMVANMSLATNRVYVDDKGEKIENTDWHNIVAFGKTAETMIKYLVGGDQILVYGTLRTRDWKPEDCKSKHYRTEIIVDRFEFGKKSVKHDKRVENNDSGAQEEASNESRNVSKPSNARLPEDEVNVDDIPF